ncbi:uroporphyrinogen-III synthase [filamentous cyanobacterium CCP5]|nr:uroporphyrinogen-III synthase [filamentous cyanobacterium CCP5]
MYLPLTDKTILVTRAAGQSSQFTQLLAAAGAVVVEMPALEIGPPSSWEPLDGAIARLPDVHWLILTSANAVDFFLERLADLGHSQADLNHLKIAVVGKKTEAILNRRGLTADFVPPDYVADAMVEHFPEDIAGKTLLFPRVESGGRPVLVEEMTTAGATVLEVPAYESGCPAELDAAAIAALRQGRIEVLTFASSKTVRHTVQLLEQGVGEGWAEVLKPVAIASIGPKTSDTCREFLGRVDIEAAEYTLEGLTEAIATWAGSSD